MAVGSELYDVIVTWRVNQVCSFQCAYCSPSQNSSVELNRYSEKAELFFERTDRTFLICMTGGEPFLNPRFVDLLEKLTSRHYIGIYTNLTSGKVFDFAKRIDPGRVEFVDCSVHLDERERQGKMDDFVRKYSMLRELGFNASASIVASPQVLRRFEEVYDYFGRRGIALLPQNLQGFFHRKHYPRGYTIEQRRKLRLYSELSEPEASRVRRNFGPENASARLIDAPYSWKGSPCAAGKDFVYLEHDGTFTRCTSEKVVLGSVETGELALYEEPRPCGVEICRCPYHGLSFAAGEPRTVKRDDMLKSFLGTALIRSYVEPLMKKMPAPKLGLYR